MIIREIIMWLSIMRHNLKDFPEVGSDNKIKALSEAIDIIHKYQLMQADYNARLKADMVAILDKVRNEIDKIHEREGSSFDCLNALDELKEFIDKIKAERGVEDGKHF